MAKEEPGRLFAKVAKFVRNPLKDWSELDAEDSSSASENGYSREMLKEMIERRQRNDFVRRREFDMLRKLRQREAAGGRDASAASSSFNVNSTSGKSDGRALTLKKIDEIEEQMSQQWWKGRAPGAEGDATRPADDAAAAERHARAYADTAAVGPQDESRASSAAAAAVGGGLHPSRLICEGAIEEAAIRFAHGDDAGAEAILLQAVAPDSPQAMHDESWLALLDLYRAIGDAEKFVQASTRYAQRMRRTGPPWLSLRALARSLQPAAAAPQPEETAPQPLAADEADWVSPARLSREGLMALTRALSAAGAVWRFDWRRLQAIEADAVAPLRALFVHWCDSPVQLRFIGGEQLLAVLANATPSNERATDDIGWQLRMAVLRAMHLPDEFELVALNYCITYEVSPPAWQDPQGDYASIEETAPVRRPDSAFSTSFLGDAAELLAEPGPAAAAAPVLAGELCGESDPVWQRLDAELEGAREATISCAALVRVDFAAAGALLNWVMARDARGERVQFVDAHRLIAAFFGVIGVADHAHVAPRSH